MPDNPRIDDLRRRVQKDPASIAFAQLGEELRRAGRSQEAIKTCRAGLEHHPAYLSARVTLGRALLEVGDLEQAELELKEVLRLAPENLAALRGVAETLQRRGDFTAALAHYEIALALAPRDADLQQTVAALRQETAAAAVRASTGSARTEAAVRPELVEGRAGAAGSFPSTQPPSSASSFNEIAEPAAEAGGSAPNPSAQHPAIPALERWADAIVADREQRSADRT